MSKKLKIAFILHGEIFQIDKLLSAIKVQFDQEFELDILTTSKSQNAILLTRDALEKGMDFLVAVGGDGTINEVVNGAMFSDKNKTVPIGILPFGRGNDFVRTLGIDKSLGKLYKSIMNKEFTKSDVGELKFIDLEDSFQTRYFINIADIGIGGVVSQYLRTGGRRFGSDFIYFFSIVRAFFTYRHQEISVETEHWVFNGPIISLIMANGRFFANGLCIAPNARIDDGIAEIVIFGKVSIWDYFKNIPAMKKAQILKHKEVLYRRAVKCEIKSKLPCPIDVDGEFVGFTPLIMQMVPNAITLIKP